MYSKQQVCLFTLRHCRIIYRTSLLSIFRLSTKVQIIFPGNRFNFNSGGIIPLTWILVAHLAKLQSVGTLIPQFFLVRHILIQYKIVQIAAYTY